MKFFLLVSSLLLGSCASKRAPIVIAHRGAPGYLPEHTLESASMAHAWNVDYVEADLVMTKDNQLVILHDTHIDTTTNAPQLYPKRKRADGRFYAIDFTLEEIKKLKVHERVDPLSGKQVFPLRFPTGTSKFEVPTFAEFVELIQGLNQSTGRNVGMYVEIKNPEFHEQNGKDILKSVVVALQMHGLTKTGSKVIIQCFYPPTLRRLKEEFKFELPLVLLIAQNEWKESSIDYERLQHADGLKEVAQYVDGIGPFWQQLVENKDGKWVQTPLMELARENHLMVHMYAHRTDELPPGMESDEQFFDVFYKDVKVDGIFSDFADRALKYLDRR